MVERYLVAGLTSVQPILGDRCGIYTLEFSDGSSYVGQSVNVSNRFLSHVHGSRHHAPWTDIVAIQFLDVPEEDLDDAEVATIRAAQRHGRQLRNKTFNLGFEGPSTLDNDLAPDLQPHWATGDTSPDHDAFSRAASRAPGPAPHALTSRIGQSPAPHSLTGGSLGDAALDDLATAVELIPAAVDLEARYWTVSDFPATSGGRLLTLTVGGLETLYIPRHTRLSDGKGSAPTTFTHVNLMTGSILMEDRPAVRRSMRTPLARLGAEAARVTYQLGSIDQVAVPTGRVRHLLTEPHASEGFSSLCLHLMRRNQAGMFRRWHSPELARRAFEQICDRIPVEQ